MSFIKYYYVEMKEQFDRLNLEKVARVYNGVQVKPENYGIGMFIMHRLTSPVIEIAGDGNTAKGIWDSPGQVTELDREGEPRTQFMWGKYGCENTGIAFMGDTNVGPFDIPESLARTMLSKPNPHGKNNSDVIRPRANAFDLTHRTRKMWIIDFTPETSLLDAALYEAPFEYIKQNVRPMRAIAKSGYCTGVEWWIHQRPRPEMRESISRLELRRFICTPRVSKHRLFV
jgi:hypothetical protein